MKFGQVLLFLLGFVTTIHALALPAAFESFTSSTRDLFKRKGGGGGGGKGGGGGSSSGGSGGSGGSSGGSSGGRGGSSSPGSSSPGSNTGGRTSTGSGPAPKSYPGGGSYYGGGGTQPYRAGNPSAGGLPVGPLLVGGALGAVFAGAWLHGAYRYNYPDEVTYHNTTTNRNMTLPVTCLCEEYAECGCDDNNNQAYINDVANNNTIARVATVDGKQTLVINGTLPNGTTAAGGADATGAAVPGLRGGLLESSGWWVIISGVVYTMWFI